MKFQWYTHIKRYICELKHINQKKPVLEKKKRRVLQNFANGNGQNIKDGDLFKRE